MKFWCKKLMSFWYSCFVWKVKCKHCITGRPLHLGCITGPTNRDIQPFIITFTSRASWWKEAWVHHKNPHRYRENRTFLLWGGSASYCTHVPPARTYLWDNCLCNTKVCSVVFCAAVSSIHLLLPIQFKKLIKAQESMQTRNRRAPATWWIWTQDLTRPLWCAPEFVSEIPVFYQHFDKLSVSLIT